MQLRIPSEPLECFLILKPISNSEHQNIEGSAQRDVIICSLIMGAWRKCEIPWAEADEKYNRRKHCASAIDSTAPVPVEEMRLSWLYCVAAAAQ